MTANELQTLFDGLHASQEIKIAMLVVATAKDLLSEDDLEIVVKQNRLNLAEILNVSYMVEEGNVAPHQIVHAYANIQNTEANNLMVTACKAMVLAARTNDSAAGGVAATLAEAALKACGDGL